tara:strand:- start:716 stop:1015 length:300 start_codon:yes stop_codon:yes gene_type:complete
MVTNGGEEVMSAYSEVNWAEELGIDVVRLEEERFGSWSHWVLLSDHNKRVKKYHASVARQEKEEAFQARVAALRNSEDYTFTDEMVQMAIGSLNAQDPV